MEQFKALVASRTTKEHPVGSPSQNKDKLLQTKLREKEVKEAFKAERQAAKETKEEERLAAAQAARFDREFNHSSKRYAKDVRVAHKKEEHDKSGFMCEHGVWRCRICQPVTKHK